MGLNNIIHPHRCHQNYSNSNGLAQLEPLQLSSSVESTSTTDSIVGSISSEVANLALSHQTTPSHTKVDTPTAINIERDRPRRPPLQHYKEAPARILLPSSITPSLSPAHSFVSETRGPSHARHHILWERRAHLLCAHCLDRYEWDDGTFNQISWPLMGRTQTVHSYTTNAVFSARIPCLVLNARE